MNLVPTEHGNTPSYWCTWDAKHPMWYIQTDEEIAPLIKGVRTR